MASVISFDRYSRAQPILPVTLSVPHAGRDYPANLHQTARLTAHRLRPLEDRFADQLATAAFAAGAHGLIARTPRAWIDLNRSEQEFDPLLVDPPFGLPSITSAKVRGGLGLIPRRIAGGGDIWQRRISAAELVERITLHHRPYHLALAAMLAQTRAKFGVSVLLDIHSMPPVAGNDTSPSPQIVFGDRFGRSSHDRFTARAVALAEQHGLVAAVNHPYAGGHILERHGDPARNIHALQIEVDRRLYLDHASNQPGAGLAEMQRFIARLVLTLGDEARADSLAIAAE